MSDDENGVDALVVGAAVTLQEVSEAAIERAQFLIGTTWDALPTPALVVDVAAADRNIERMAAHAAAAQVSLRPHAKAHKTAELARRQLAAGATGVTVATVWEALALARASVPDILIANEIVGPAKIAALVDVASTALVTVAVDHLHNVDELATAAAAAGVELAVVVEVDLGMGRGGARSPSEAVELAEHVCARPSLRLAGVIGYEGHLVVEVDAERRRSGAARAYDRLLETVEAVERAGFTCSVVSVGGTGTYEFASAYDRITDLQVGSYVLMDAFHETLVPDRFEQALAVVSTVISRHGRTVVLDAGRKSVGHELAPSSVVGHSASARSFAEEHALFDLASSPTLDVGDRVLLIPGYTPTTVNLHDVLFAIADGTVIDVWRVLARGSLPLA